MNEIQKWASLLCMACLFCTLIEFFVPPGKIQKVLNIVIGAFMICIFMYPFSGKDKVLDFKPKHTLNGKLHESESQVIKGMNTQLENIAAKNIEAVIARSLKNIGVKYEKIEIFMDTNEDSCIVMIRCKIYIQQKYAYMQEKIKHEVEEILKINTQIIIDV